MINESLSNKKIVYTSFLSYVPSEEAGFELIDYLNSSFPLLQKNDAKIIINGTDRSQFIVACLESHGISFENRIAIEEATYKFVLGSNFSVKFVEKNFKIFNCDKIPPLLARQMLCVCPYLCMYVICPILVSASLVT